MDYGTRARKLIHAKGLGVLVIVSLAVALLAPRVFGQSSTDQPGFNLSVTPTTANLQAKPGTAASTQIQVRNNNVNAERVKVSLLKLESNNQDGSPVLREPGASDEFLKWVNFSETSFVAEPNVWKSIDFTINPPQSAAFGYYYAVVFTREDGQGQTQVTNLTGAIAVPVLLDVVAPGTIRKASIEQFKSDRKTYEFLPATFTVELRNDGNTHISPRGNVFITKGGKSVGMLEVNQGRGNILPDSRRQFSAEWSEGSPAYKIKEENGQPVLDGDKPKRFLDWSNFDPSKVRFGKYHAKVALVYNDGVSDIATEAGLDFWVIPWRILGVALLVFLLVGAGIWALVIRPLRRGVKKLPAIRRLKKKQ